MKTLLTVVIGMLFTLCSVSSAEAYVGPGAGLGLLGALWGLLATVALAVGYLILWPLRRLRRQRQAAEREASATDSQDPGDSGAR